MAIALLHTAAAAQSAPVFQGQVSNYTTKQIYHSPETPGYTSWVGMWQLPNGTIQIDFVQATGPKNSPVISYPVLQTTNAGRTWIRVPGDTAAGYSRGMAILPDGTRVRPATSGMYFGADGHLQYPNHNFLGVQYSNHGGATWSQAINLVSPADYQVCLPLMLKPLRDGRLVAMAGLTASNVAPDKVLANVVKTMFVSSDQGKTWGLPITLMTVEQGVCEESDFVELPNGDLFFMHRLQHYDANGTYLSQDRRQSTVKKVGQTFEPLPPTTPPWTGQGFPCALLTQEGILLDLDLFGSHWSDDFGQTWHNLMVANEQLKTNYYPRAVQTADGTIVVVGHIRYDDEYGAVDESIVMQSFRLSAERTPDLASSDDLRLAGMWGAAQSRSAERMATSPLDKPDFILADLSQKQKRRYIDYSGDISGRWIGAAAFLAPLYPKPFAAFPAIMAEIPTYQKRDGHFGVDQDVPPRDHERDTAILWGNGRLLIGLVEVYERTGDQKALQTAKKIGEYFIATDPAYNKPENLIRKPGGYSLNLETYYLSCIEGLVALGRVTKDQRYLDEGKRIAELALTVKDFDSLHSHGRLCAARGIVDLYAVTGDRRWLEAAEHDWNIFMERYRLPTGGVKEVLEPTCNRDEGCAEGDWLRLNLSLSRLTDDGRYLDEAERCLKGHFIFQQMPNGGAGHRIFHQIDGQPVAFKDAGEEAWWCCSKHWARATVDIARFAVTSGEQGPNINLMIDCEGSVAGPGGKWKATLRETEDGLHAVLESPVPTKATVRIHRPAWAGEESRIEKPGTLLVRETKDAWLIDGVWSGAQAIAVHLPTTLRSEATPNNTGVLLRGHDLLVAHNVSANAWLLSPLSAMRPVVLWAATLRTTDGRIIVPASLTADADPNRPEQWHLLELSPLRAVAGEPHDIAWFSFQIRTASPSQIATLTAAIR